MPRPPNENPEEWLPDLLASIPQESFPGLLRQIADAQGFLSQTLPEGDRGRQIGGAAAQFAELAEAYRSGRWTGNHDRILEAVRRTLDDAGTTDDPNAVMMSLMAAALAGDRLVHAAQHPQTEEPPGASEIRAAIDDLEAALAAFELVSFPLPREMVTNGARARVAQLNRMLAAARTNPPPGTRRSGLRRPGKPGEDESPAADGDRGNPGAPGMPSRSALDGMRFLANILPADHESRPSIRALVITLDIIHASTLEQPAEIEPMAAELTRLAEDDTLDADERKFARAGLALARGIHCHARTASPRPGDWPGTAELTETIARLEEAAESVAGLPQVASAIGPILASLRTRLAEEQGRSGAGPGSGGENRVPPGDRDTSAVVAAIQRALHSGNITDLDTAISETRAVSRELPAGHPARASILTGLAALLHQRAGLNGGRDDIPAATDAAIAAVRAAAPGAVREPAYVLSQLLGRMTTRGHNIGPFESAESALSDALAGASGDDTRMLLNLGIGGARMSRAMAAGDPAPLRAAIDSFTAAESLLGEARPAVEWFEPAFQLLAWVVNGAMSGGAGPDAFSLADRLSGRLEDLLVRHPELAGQLNAALPAGPVPFPVTGDEPPVLQAIRFFRQFLSLFSGDSVLAQMIRANPQGMQMARLLAAQSPFAPPVPGETRGLAVRALDTARHALRAERPDATVLRAAGNDLRAALAGGLDDDALRHQVDGVLGMCLARLHWLGEPDPPAAPPGLTTLLAGAIHHLERALSDSEHLVPDPERAEQTDLLSRCYRRSAERRERRDGAHQAELTAHAALREFARCVLISDGADDGLPLAERANEIVTRTAGWCLADNRPASAVAIAEAGRGLVLASSILTGRVAEILDGAGEHDAARAWGQGDRDGRRTALDALWRTRFGGSLLRTPAADEISALLLMTGSADAIVYLIPSGNASRDRAWPLDAAATPGRALVCRAGVSDRIDELPLPGVTVGSGSPLAGYHAAFAGALASAGPARWDPGEDASAGNAWLRALDELGAWTYDHIMGPLAGHVAQWGGSRVPRLVLVPLGELAAIPFAAAWTPEAALPGGRRYAIHDLVLSYAVTGRLLAEVGRRHRRRLSDRVVFASTGEFPFARATARALVRQLYPDAEVYGRGNSPDGPATTERILKVLPGSGGPGASLLNLTTHGASEPVARLQTADGWLTLDTILRTARGRRAAEPGGLVITNACLTDSTRSHYDEFVTLATALLAAGVTGVIGTRWPVYEDTSAALTYYLHHHLAAAHDPAAALRLAQLDLLAEDPPGLPGQPRFLAGFPHRRRAHPASWAGYTCHGI